METKLEFKHIVPYLPYGLQLFYNENDIRTMLYLDISFDSRDIIFKPLFIPLSLLTDNQWVEIFKVGFVKVGHEVWPIGEYFIERHDLAVEIIVGSKSYSYHFTNNQFETGVWAFNQKVAFEKIYEYQGDIDLLIMQGLALNKLNYIK